MAMMSNSKGASVIYLIHNSECVELNITNINILVKFSLSTEVESTSREIDSRGMIKRNLKMSIVREVSKLSCPIIRDTE